MDMHAGLEIARKLRELATLGDYGYSHSDLILELIAMADDYQDAAEAIEMEMQRELMETN